MKMCGEAGNGQHLTMNIANDTNITEGEEWRVAKYEKTEIQHVRFPPIYPHLAAWFPFVRNIPFCHPIGRGIFRTKGDQAAKWG
ncbi:hypothetical protein DB346_02445 [Verrucomicrobia bacterium LW23]|nr:hypothetical protein DB346_02445 [Verrucomicrobia bacterium LW23]